MKTTTADNIINVDFCCYIIYVINNHPNVLLLDAAGLIALFFARVLFGGMLLGFAMGKICSAWLAKIFNDAVTETIITIAFPYITYFIGK